MTISPFKLLISGAIVDERRVNLFYRGPLRLTTETLIGFADAPEIVTFVGTEVAVKVTPPRFDGFQEQETVKVEPEPVANFDLHPGITIFAALKVTFEAAVTLTLI